MLGENTKRFDKLPPPDQQSILEKLTADLDDPERAKDAKAARDFLLKRGDKIADAMDVDQLAMKCAESDDPFLRELSAFASISGLATRPPIGAWMRRSWHSVTTTAAAP